MVVRNKFDSCDPLRDWKFELNRKFCKKHNLFFSLEDDCPKRLTKDVSKLKNKSVSSITSRQTLGIKLRNEKLSYAKIGERLGISKQSAQELISRGLNKVMISSSGNKLVHKVSDLIVRLHNDELEFKTQIDYNSLNWKTILKNENLEHKLRRKDNVICKLHKNNTLTVRFLKDISELSPDVCFEKANVRIENYLRDLEREGFIIGAQKIINRHYAILGTTIAKDAVVKKNVILIRDPTDGKIRITVDASHGKPEMEFEHVLHNKEDSTRWKAIIEDFSFNTKYLPSENENMVFTILKTQESFAKNLALHLEVMTDMKATLKDIRDGLKKKKKRSLVRRSKTR